MGGPGHASDGGFLPCKILLKTIDFERPGGREWLPFKTPFQKFYTFFGRVFGPARVQISYGNSLRRGFFLQRRKNVFKSSYGVRGMGPPQGPAFACTVTTINKTKKQKLKKTQVLFRTVMTKKHFVFSQRAPKCFIVITVLNKTCVFLVFAFLFCLLW